MARTAGPGQANDEAPRTSFFQVTFDQLVVPVALRSPSRRIGHEDNLSDSICRPLTCGLQESSPRVLSQKLRLPATLKERTTYA